MKTSLKRGPLLFWVISFSVFIAVLWFSLRRPPEFAADKRESEGSVYPRIRGDDTARALPVLGEIPPFKLTERGGETVGLGDLKGKVWVADFIFTRCAGVCPLMSSNMKSLQTVLEAEQGIRFVSFSVDPDYDSPAALAEYGRRFGADTAKWFFLTGDRAEIYRLAEQHFHLGVGEVPPEEREALDQAIRHSSKFVLVDRAGRIRGYYDGEGGRLDDLIRDATGLLKGGV